MNKKIAAIGLGLLMAVAPMLPAVQCFAADENTTVQNKEIIKVGSEGELKYCLSSQLKDGTETEIILTKDIELCNELILDSNVTLNLNDHTLKIAYPNNQIQIGSKKLVGKIPHQIYHKGYWSTNYKTITRDSYGNSLPVSKWGLDSYDVWIPGHYTTEYEDVYDYSKVKVTIKNGVIKGSDVIIPENNQLSACRLANAHGKNGMKPASLLYLTSGSLKLEGVKLAAGDGSAGGNATYSRVWYIPFFVNGNGGNGGSGANGGDIFYAEQGTIAVDPTCTFSPGKGGKAGCGSLPNPKNWVFKGKKGKDGQDGKKGDIINDWSKLLIL